ncbi:hypothetical protein GXP67_27530 [Rhodocytophaga rosea]|uniref:DUF3575 domain-containing protein n=1 Tax=Rhodocytophaga rosea TaxID=2704465 RepID=A0A6C0GQ07_9BACT|nr:hypothetical protein [Rhodocytophaga rosea]QHT70131.1 hypothetical protein GXP67_27530 [Rhodocytophaga rosea]
MKQLIVLFACIFTLGIGSVHAQQKEWAIGLRLGDPSGLNIKKYFGKNNAFDLSIGSYGNFYGRGRSYRSGYYGNAGIAIMGNYLWQKNIPNANGLTWYYGLGGMFSSRRYYVYDSSKRVYSSNVALGATATIGLEYFIPNTPISFFGDVSAYVEIVPAPFWINLPLGIGGRFNF